MSNSDVIKGLLSDLDRAHLVIERLVEEIEKCTGESPLILCLECDSTGDKGECHVCEGRGLLHVAGFDAE